MIKKKIYAVLLAGSILISFVGCDNTQEPTDTINPKQTVTADVTSTENTSDDITAETTETTVAEEQESTTKQEPTTEKETMKVTHTVKEETPTRTETTKPAEPETKPTNPPKNDVPTQPTEQTNATAKDAKAIANKVVECVNEYRNVPATQLSGLTKYAEYRSRQLVSNFAHDTDDERAAATALKYGKYIVPADYGLEGEPYYTACAGDAIAKSGYVGTVDEVARKFAQLVRNSPEHWAYIGDSEYKFIGVGLTYRNGMWYCDIAVNYNNYG